jgi:hypothetical protein
LPWLKAALCSDPDPAVIAAHYPVSGESMIGNRYFESQPSWAFPPDHQLVRKALKQSGRCRVWLSGHIHQNTFSRIDSTYHVSIQSLSEEIAGQPSLCFGMFEITEVIRICIVALIGLTQRLEPDSSSIRVFAPSAVIEIFVDLPLRAASVSR